MRVKRRFATLVPFSEGGQLNYQLRSGKIGAGKILFESENPAVLRSFAARRGYTIVEDQQETDTVPVDKKENQ